MQTVKYLENTKCCVRSGSVKNIMFDVLNCKGISLIAIQIESCQKAYGV